MKAILRLVAYSFLCSVLLSCSDKLDELHETLQMTDKVIASYTTTTNEKNVKEFTDPQHIAAFTDLVLEKHSSEIRKIAPEHYLRFYKGDSLLLYTTLVTVDKGTNIYFSYHQKVYLIPLTYRAENIMRGL